MKTFIVNAAKNAVTTFKKHEVSSKLMGKEWKMLSDDPSISGKYIFLKDGKLLLSVNGISSYSTWQMVTDSTIIMDEGVATFLYKVVHIDENIVVLNLDGTNSLCFLINVASQALTSPSLEAIQWYLYRHSEIDILSEDQKQKIRQKKEGSTSVSLAGSNEEQGDNVAVIMLIIMIGSALIFGIIIATL